MSEARRRAFVFLVPFLVYLSTGRLDTSGDARPSRYLPLSLLREGNLDLDEFPQLLGPSGELPYYLRAARGHVISAFSPGPALLALPVYLLPVLGGLDSTSHAPLVLEKLTAAAVAALSVLVLYRAAREIASERAALTMAIVYAFGTSTFSVSSQALWEHGPAQLFLALALWLGLRKDGADEPLLALALALAVVMRPTVLLLAAPFAPFFLGSRRRLARGALWAAAPLAAIALYDHVYFGAPWRTGRDPILAAWNWTPDPLAAAAGLLVSPGRGLLVYSPVLALSVVGLAIGWRRSGIFPALAAGSGLLFAALSFRIMWWGGWCFGPRLLADATPGLCLALVPVLEKPGRWARRFVLALAVPSIAFHSLGAYFDDGSWDRRAGMPLDVSRLWSWTDTPVLHAARRAATLPARVRGNLLVGIMPSSLDAPGSLVATYEVTAIPPRVVPAGHVFGVGVRARNAGRAFWLARDGDSRGGVRLAWRWFCDGVRLPDSGERENLDAPVLPGGSYDFDARIRAPLTPGECLIHIELLSELVTWFSDAGSPPLLAAVRVESASAASSGAAW